MTGDNEEQLKDLFQRSHEKLMQRIERDRRVAVSATEPSPEEDTAIPLASEQQERMADQCTEVVSIDDTLRLADALIDLCGCEIKKTANFDDAEVPQNLIEEAAARWNVTVKEVEQYVWSLHDMGAPYQYIKDYLRDIED